MARVSESEGGAELGWEQGTLLPEGTGVLALQWIHPDHPATKPGRRAVKAKRRREDVAVPFPLPIPAKDGDRMMVVSQSCDLVKPAEELPQVEVARVFRTENPRIVAQAQDFGSARFFRLNDVAHEAAEVLDYGQRAFIDKGFLEAVQPDNRLLNQLPQEQRRLLARWLGQRLGRPAVPNLDYEEIARPIREAWKELLDDDPAAARGFNREYAEWRYRREEDNSLTIYILSRKDEPDELVALELVDFLTSAVEQTYDGSVFVATDKRSYSTFTMSDELTTEQISMEWASHDERFDDAALPP